MIASCSKVMLVFQCHADRLLRLAPRSRRTDERRLSLSAEKRQQLHDVLRANKECEGAEACWNAQRMEP